MPEHHRGERLMNCPKCGWELPADTKFCPNCGENIQRTSENDSTVVLRCKNCGGTMNVTEDSHILVCPFCGSKEFIRENDEETVRRVKDEVLRDMNVNTPGAEEKRKIQEKQEKRQASGKKRLGIVSFIFLIFCVTACIRSFSDSKFPAGVIAALQTGLFGCACFWGMQSSSGRKAAVQGTAAGLGFILIIPFFMFAARNPSVQYVWPESGIAAVLPKPDLTYGKINLNSDSYFDLDVYNAYANDFTVYVNACRQKGFTVDASTSTGQYDAFNEDGYEVELMYFDSTHEFSVRADAPKAVGKLSWPTGRTASLLPVPKSKVGNTVWEYEDGFEIYVGDTTIEDYNDYVEACMAKGFTVGYDKGKKYFYADNAEGYNVSVRYEGNKVMSVEIQAPRNSTQSARTASQSSAAA